jgi:hypothetical protein
MRPFYLPNAYPPKDGFAVANLHSPKTHQQTPKSSRAGCGSISILDVERAFDSQAERWFLAASRT